MSHPTILVTRDASAHRHPLPRTHLLLAATVATLAASHAHAQSPVDSASRADTTVRVAMQPAAPIPASQADSGRGDQPAARLHALRHLDASVALRGRHARRGRRDREARHEPPRGARRLLPHADRHDPHGLRT